MVQFFPVAENIWCVRRPSYLTCSYVVRTDAGFVFLDAGMSSDGHDVKTALQALGAAPKDVLGTLLTHWHNDHSSGAAYLEAAGAGPIYCHPKEGEKLTRGPGKSFGSRMSRFVPESGPLVLLKGLLNDGPSVQLRAFQPAREGDLLLGQFRVLETPGHTPGHLSFLDLRNRALFAGDALAVVHGKVRRMARPVTEDHALALEAMRRLASLEFDILCPGHRDPMLNAREPMAEFRRSLTPNAGWPLFG